jgi:uncharacterized membrane protein
VRPVRSWPGSLTVSVPGQAVLGASRARLASTSDELSHVTVIVGVSPLGHGHNHHVTDTQTAPRRPWILAIFLVVAGAAGWWAAFNLTLDKFAVLENPQAELNSNISFLVQCGKNLSSPQGSAFGFPNPLIGLGGFAAVIAVGVGLLAGAAFARWFWIAFNIGIAGALAFVIWLIGTSIFVLGTLCPWCMLVWLATIPLFWVVTLRNLREGVYGSSAAGVGRALMPWVIPITIGSYLIVAIIAQVVLDVIHRV